MNSKPTLWSFRHYIVARVQVLRYAYGGVPMWCCDTPAATDAVTRKWAKSSAGLPAVISVPRCEACGGERLFEMQLMPALSDYLVERQPLASAAVDVCRLLKSSGINENKSEKSVGILDGLQLLKLSMGVLCVWSCEASCDGGSCEYTIFQPLD